MSLLFLEAANVNSAFSKHGNAMAIQIYKNIPSITNVLSRGKRLQQFNENVHVFVS